MFSKSRTLHFGHPQNTPYKEDYLCYGACKMKFYLDYEVREVLNSAQGTYSLFNGFVFELIGGFTLDDNVTVTVIILHVVCIGCVHELPRFRIKIFHC